MTSSIKSQSIARRSSYGDKISSGGVVNVSASQRGTLNGAIGVLASLGGPGGTGRIGSGRTRSWPGDEIDPSSTVRCVLGELGVIRTSGELGDPLCGGASGRIKPGRIRRELGDGVPGGDHAGGGVLGRGWLASVALYGTGGRSVGPGG
jgi:hypothetical protein